MEDSKDLKIQALREQFSNKVAVLTDDYENRIADLRIELTQSEQNNQALIEALTELKEADVQTQDDGSSQE